MVSPEGPARGWQWFGWSVGLAVLVQLALFAYATAPGLAGTGDSGFYLHAANTLRTTGHLLNPDGSAYRYWPPLYPVLLALGGSMGAARLLHGLCLLLSLLSWSWLGRRILPPAVASVLPWALALSTPWLVVSKFVWGETVFLALAAAYVAALFQWLRKPQGQWWALVTGLGFLLPLHRTPGFFLLAGIGLGLLFEYRKLQPKMRFWLLAHFVISLLGGIAWHFYALLVAAPSVYKLNRGWFQFFDSAADYGFVLSRWLLPVRAAWRPEWPVVWAIAMVAILGWLWPRPLSRAAAPQLESPADTEYAAATVWARALPRTVWICLVFFVLMLLISTTFTRSASGLYDSERYASVLFGPVVLLVLHRVGRAWNSGMLPRWLLLGGLALWLAFAAGRAGSNAISLHKLPVLAWPR